MNIHDLELFISVASLGSFAAAAREMNVDPSTISRSISNLEGELGVRLFHRTTRTTSLTEEGEAYLQRVKPVVGELHQAAGEIQSVSSEPQGTVRITSSIAFAERKLIPLLSEYRKRFPLLRPELILSDENLDLAANRIDLALRLGEEVRGDLVVSRCVNTRYFVCASPDYIALKERLDKPADLSMHECLVFTIPEFRTSWLFKDTNGLDSSVEINSGVAISNALALRTAAIEGLGPALLADWLVEDDLQSGRLVNLFPKHRVTGTSFDTAIWFVYLSRNYVPNKVRVTIDFLRRTLNQR